MKTNSAAIKDKYVNHVMKIGQRKLPKILSELRKDDVRISANRPGIQVHGH